MRSSMVVDAQLIVGLRYSFASRFSYLPSRWLGGRPCKTYPFREPQNPNRIASDAMDHPIWFLCCCLLGWNLGSKLSATQDISSCCCSSQLLDSRQILGCLLFLCCCTVVFFRWFLFFYFYFLLLFVLPT